MDGKSYEDFELGETFRSDGRTITEADIRLFVGATGATHPLHVDKEYAQYHPIVDDVAAHGVLALSVADGFLANFVTKPAAIGLNYGHETVRYVSPVYPGDTLTVDAEIVDTTEKSEEWGVLDVNVEVCNQDGDVVISQTQQFIVARETHPELE